MSAVTATWGASIRSGMRSVFTDPRMAVAWGLTLLIDGAAIIWISSSLQNAPESLMWLVSGGAWAAIVAVGLLSAFQQGFAAPQARLQITLPVTDTTRFRTLYGLVWLDGLWNWLLIPFLSMAIALGWRSLEWLVLLASGAAFAAAWSVILSILVRRALGTPLRAVLWAVGFAVVLMVIAFAARQLGVVVAVPGTLPVTLALIVATAVVLGPLAGEFGRYYEQTYSKGASRSGSRVISAGALSKAIDNIFTAQPTLTGAFLYKEYRLRSRRTLDWLRLLMPLGAIAVFPWISELIAPLNIMDWVFVSAFASGLCFVTAFDGFASPIGGEGNRMTLLLTAPVGCEALLRAKYLAFLIPFLAVLAPVVIALSWLAGLGAGDVVLAFGTSILVLLGMSAVFAWGSAWDLDLNAEVEGGLQAIIQEETAITPKRLMISGIAMGVIGLQFLAVLTLPALGAIGVAAISSGLVGIASWLAASSALKRLVRS